MALRGGPAGRKIRAARIALPSEHGSWGIVLEPLVAAAAIAPSAAAPFIVLAVLGLFLLRQPLKFLILEKTSPRPLGAWGTALLFAAIYGMAAAAGVAFTAYLVPLTTLSPFLLLLPVGVLQICSDVTGQQRRLLPELAGPVAISGSAAVLVLAAGGPMWEAVSLWLLFVLRSVPSVLYVRERLRLEKGKEYAELMPSILHAAAISIFMALAVADLTPFLPVVVFLLLFVRSANGLSIERKRMKAMQIGIREVIYGALLVAAVITGFYAGF